MMTEEEAATDGIKVVRYEHGGGRIYIEKDGARDLVMDLYDDEGGTRRDKIISALLRYNMISPRAAG